MENTKIKANLQFNLLKENNSNYLKLIHPPKSDNGFFYAPVLGTLRACKCFVMANDRNSMFCRFDGCRR